MSSNRQWMYKRLTKGLYDPEFVKGVQQFIEFAMNHPEGRDGERLRCPCNRKKCQNRNIENVHTVHGHLLSNGFVPGYHVWYLHGEKEVTKNIDQNEMMYNRDHTVDNLPMNIDAFNEPGPGTSYHRMVHEAAGPSFDPNDMEESPNPDAQKFYEMIDSANQEVWPGCETHSQLSAVARLLHMKSEHHLSERCFDDICQYLNELTPEIIKISEARSSEQYRKNIPNSIWESWKPLWETDAFKAKSTQCSKNRLSEKCGEGSGPSRHTGGSHSHREHARQLEIVLGRPPHPHELLKKTHIKANNEFVDMKSKSTYDAVVSKITSASQPVDESVESPTVDFSKIYMVEVGGVKKACIYGLGSQAVYYKNAGPSSSISQLQDHDFDTRVKECVQEMKEEMKHEMREEMREEIRQELREK